MSTQYPLTSGTGDRSGIAWANRLDDTGTPAALSAYPRFVSVQLSGAVRAATAAVQAQLAS